MLDLNYKPQALFETVTPMAGNSVSRWLACLHRDGFNLPSLVFDMMEPFRPIADKMLLEAVLSGKLKNVAQAEENGQIKLSDTGRKQVITLFANKLGKTMVYKNKKALFKNHILSEINNLKKQIEKI